MAKRKKLTKGVLCRDGEDHQRFGDPCILFTETTRGCVYKAENSVWLVYPIVSKTVWWWKLKEFRRRFPTVRIPTRGTCRETSLLI